MNSASVPDPELLAGLPRRFGFALALANLAGAVVVFVFTAFVLPLPGVPHNNRLTAINAAVFVPFMVFGLRLGASRFARAWKRDVGWLTDGLEPTPARREALLRYPLTQQRILIALWTAPVIVFTALNAAFSGRVALYVGIAIVLGALVTCAISYLLAERLLRPLFAGALATGVPERPQLPGVAARALLSWTLGSGVLLLAVGLVAVVALAVPGISTTRLAVSVIVLSLIGMVVGLMLVAGLARSLAERIQALRSAAATVGRGQFDQDVAVDDGSEVGLLQADFNRMIAGLRERERLRDLFGRQVGEDVVRRALDRGVELGGEVCDAAVLFIDLQGSTALAETWDPAEVVSLLNSFFAIVVEVVGSHGGWVNKFEGDAALCVFGVPLPDPDGATQALAAARLLRERLTDALPEVRAGIGVSAGRVVAGNIGAARRFEYTVIGDPVNEGARLCELAKGRTERVLASQAALSRASREEQAAWSWAEEITLRGRSAQTRTAVPALEVSG